MSAVIVPLPDPLRLRAAFAAIAVRADELHAPPERRRHAKAVCLREMQCGRSAGAAVALANSALKPMRGIGDVPRGAA